MFIYRDFSKPAKVFFIIDIIKVTQATNSFLFIFSLQLNCVLEERVYAFAMAFSMSKEHMHIYALEDKRHKNESMHRE